MPSTQVRAPVVTQTQTLMGTVAEIAIVDTGADYSAAFRAAFAEIARVEAMCSAWKADSELSKVNAAAGNDAVVVSEELFALVELALSYATQTGGAFDPTFAALWGLWTFGDDGIDTPPDPELLKSRLTWIDYESVALDHQTHSIRLAQHGMKISLGGVAKGYATDRAAAQLREAGIANFVIKFGGELYAAGSRGTRSWRVGIQDPRGDDPFAGVDIRDKAFTTSGDYERYFEFDGVRYHHIIDPATGYPARASRSVTVLASTAVEADALSTALFVLGYEKGVELVESRAGVEAVWVTGENEVKTSSGLAHALWIFHPPTP